MSLTFIPPRPARGVLLAAPESQLFDDPSVLDIIWLKLPPPLFVPPPEPVGSLRDPLYVLELERSRVRSPSLI